MSRGAQENRRVREAITQALFTLLKTKAFSGITVTDLVTEAGVARASYYRNFENKQAVVEEAIHAICRELAVAEHDQNPESLRSYDALVKRLEHSLTCVLKRGPDLLALYQNGFGGLVLESMNRYLETAAGDMPSTSVERYQLYFVTGAVFNVLMKWLESGAKESPQKMAKACADFLYGKSITDMI